MENKQKIVTLDKNVAKTQTVVSLTAVFILVIIGVPVWWRATGVYRAVLPYDEIEQLNGNRIANLTVEIKLSCNVGTVPTNLKALLEFDLEKSREKAPPSHLSFKYNVNTMTPGKALLSKPGEIFVEFITNDDADRSNIKVTSGRKIKVFLRRIDSFDAASSSKLADVIRNVLVNEDFLNDAGRQILEKSESLTGSSSGLQKMMKLGTKFEVLFSLLLPHGESEYFDWNIEDAIDKYLTNFLTALRKVYDIDVGSQVHFSNPAYFRPRHSVGGQLHSTEEETEVKYVTKEQLSQAINKIENRLGAHTSVDAALSLVVHVVDKKHRPLQLLKEDGDASATNAFLIPRWGGMILYNPPALNASSSSVLNVDSLIPMFVSHLRVLLGGLDNTLFRAINDEDDSSVVFEAPRATGMALWELDFLFRLRSVENVATSVHSVKSLSKLLNKIGNIVINDEVAKAVYVAVDAIERTRAYLADNKLEAAVKESKRAFTSSETAFFDPTMLELLYFPEDQKFAIYCPLFVPVAITVVMSLVFTVKRWRESTKVKND